MNVTAAVGALDVARAHGYVEGLFTPTEQVPADGEGEANAVDVWGHECDDDGRHAIIVGQLRDAHFVMLVLRNGAPDMGYALEEMRDVFRMNFNLDANVDTEGSGTEVWSSPKVSREIAVAVARELVMVDRRERDQDLEIAFGIMTS